MQAPPARAVPEDQVVRVVREGLEDQAVRVVPGDPEEDRVDPAGTNDPAVSAGGLLRRRLRCNYHSRQAKHILLTF